MNPRLRRSISGLALFTFTTLGWFSGLGAADIDKLAEQFFTFPECVNPEINNGGTHMAFIAREKSSIALATLNLENLKIAGVREERGREVANYGWADDDHLIVNVGVWGRYTMGLAVMRAGSTKISMLNSLAGGNNPLSSIDHNDRYFRLVDPLPQMENKILVTEIRDQRNPYPDAKYITLSNGRVETAAENFGEVSHWMADYSGEVRFAFEIDKGRTSNYVRDADADEWRKLERTSYLSPLAVVAGGRGILCANRKGTGNGFTGIGIIDSQTGENLMDFISKEPFDIDVDQDDLFRNPETGELLALHYHTDRPQTLWFDRGIRTVVNGLEKGLQASIPDCVVRPIGFGNDMTRIYLTVSSDRQPLTVVAFDMKSRKFLTVKKSRPEIDWKKMAPMEPITFPAEDGTTIYGYLTRPKGKGPFPLVVDVIGGPAVRNYWGFNPFAQFFAAQGYAVLQVNYRGCSGYGYDYDGGGDVFFHAVGHAPGDIIDSVRWAISEGIADPERVAIHGGSFGAYTGMVAAAEAPDLFRCVVAYAGVYDLPALYDEDRREVTSWVDDMYIRFEKRRTYYESRSPVHMAEQVKASVYLIHGTEDLRVPEYQAKQMHSRLKDAGVDSTLDIVLWGRHGNRDWKDSIRYHAEVARFIQKKLKL